MVATETIINSVLCFINSANSDYSLDSLTDVLYSFYSHDEIKVAKELLFNLLKKDVHWRRDPDKKRKDLKDLLDAYEELKTSNIKVDLVTKSHKKMPPVGLEIFAPILNSLAEDISKINELLPKILDIKSEVVNTADTVRQMKIDVSDLKDKFSTAINGMESAAKDFVVKECDVIEELHSFRQSLNISEDLQTVTERQRRSSLGLASGSYAAAISKSPGGADIGQNQQRRPDIEEEARPTASAALVTNPLTGGVTKGYRKNDKRQLPTTTILHETPENESPNRLDEVDQVGAAAEWTLVQRNKKKREHLAKRTQFARVTGSLKTSSGHSFRAAIRMADVFIGRVHKDVTCECLSEYINNSFHVNVEAVSQLDIRSDRFNAFKVTVKLSDRDKLFNAELWPEDILVNKFYSRSKNLTDKVTES